MPGNLLLFVVAVASFAGPQTPQAPPAPPPAAAKPFPLALALDAAQAALASCQAANAAAVVEVMDTAFNPKVILAADGTRPNLVEFARRKAYTVIKTGQSSADFGTSVGPQGRGAGPINGDASLITFGGGIPILINNELVAALSVSGPTGPVADEACAKAGLARIGPLK